jgi:hypothetical protein
MNTTIRAALVVGFSAITLSTLGSSAQAVNLVQNGSFETTSGYGQLGFNTTVANWTNGLHQTSPQVYGYNFIFSSGNVDTTGVNGDAGNLSLHGPNNGTNNGLGASPDGGNFIAADGAYHQAAIGQLLNGLTVGQQYFVSFYDAGAQQFNFNGATTDLWQVSFGSQTQNSTLFNNPNHGFTGWQKESLMFTATAASQTLSFLAVGTPNGTPPFSLLDGVSVEANTVPEPLEFAGTIAGVSLCLVLRSKLAKKKSATNQ